MKEEIRASTCPSPLDRVPPLSPVNPPWWARGFSLAGLQAIELEATASRKVKTLLPLPSLPQRIPWSVIREDMKREKRTNINQA